MLYPYPVSMIEPDDRNQMLITDADVAEFIGDNANAYSRLLALFISGYHRDQTPKAHFERLDALYIGIVESIEEKRREDAMYDRNRRDEE